ncbi:olfactory receptor 5G9-like [Hyperolius riggenbachi]|uniref:olfactory receptor 5G9-like n=1 Tax=Hyperolius riggenbachi TaxID=752182 RepID=UPI0035A2CA2D
MTDDTKQAKYNCSPKKDMKHIKKTEDNFQEDEDLETDREVVDIGDSDEDVFQDIGDDPVLDADYLPPLVSFIQEMNQTEISEFVLLGLTTNYSLQLLLFVSFFLTYLCSFLSNLGMIILIRVSQHLNTPMYFFLSHLSFIDLCYSTSITPRMLSDCLSIIKSISFIGCAAQMFSFAMFATSESFLVTAMAYDRYVAISHPLFYHCVMNESMCWRLVSGAYSASFLASITHTITVFKFPLCGSNIINHFYCDIPPLLKLTCAYSYARKWVVFSLAFAMGVASFLVILMSYVSIIFTIVGIKSAEGRSKAFSTCASHLSVVISFYSAVFGNYFLASLNSESISKVFSILYTVVSPLLNPLIYSLKNAEVKKAIGISLSSIPKNTLFVTNA